MLDERWDESVEEIGDALRKILQNECTPEAVRAAENHPECRLPTLEAELESFGLGELEGDADLFARIAFELGRALAPTAHVECMPAQALLGLQCVAYTDAGRPVPAQLSRIAVASDKGVLIKNVSGTARKTTAGDWLLSSLIGEDVETIEDPLLADRLSRYASLVEAARLVGASQGLLEYAARYTTERYQFGKPIGGYQGVAHKLADAAIAADGAELLVRKAAFMARPATGGDGAPDAIFADMVRAKAIKSALLVATHCHQVLGGAGFAMEYDVQLYSRRIRSWAARGPRAQSSFITIARTVLDPAKRDDIRLLWQYDKGMPLPRWAREADTL